MTVHDAIRRVKDLRTKAKANARLPSSKDTFTQVEPAELLFQARLDTDKQHFPQGILSTHGGCNLSCQKRDPACLRPALIEVDCSVEGSCLSIAFVAPKQIGNRSRIDRWMKMYQEALIDMATTLSPRPIAWCLSDMPLLRTSYEELDRFQHAKLLDIGIKGMADVSRILPCTPVQEGILLAQKRGTSTYMMTSMVKLTPKSQASSIDLKRLVSAWHLVVRRHDVLGSIFVEFFRHAGIFQMLVLCNHNPLTEILPQQPTDEQCLQKLHELSDQAVALNRPSHTFSVCASSQGLVFCLLVVDHALVDQHSIPILWSDICIAYDGRLSVGDAPSHAQMLSGVGQNPEEKALAYWERYLQDASALHFPQAGKQYHHQ